MDENEDDDDHISDVPNADKNTGLIFGSASYSYNVSCASLLSTTDNHNTTEDLNFDMADAISNLSLVELHSSDDDVDDKSKVNGICKKNVNNSKTCVEDVNDSKACWEGVSNSKGCWENVTQCSYTNDDTTVCPECFMLRNVEQSDFDNFKINGSYSVLYEENSSLDLNNALLCSNCFLLQNSTTSLGSKRKSQEACYGLHKQINQSKELVEESTSWLSNSHSLFKKPKIPAPNYETLLEPILSETFDIINKPFTVGSHEGNGVELVLDKTENELIDLDEENLFDELNYIEHTEGERCTSPFSFESLPAELKLKIFSYFTQRDLCRYIAPICSSWFQLSKDISFWQHLDVSPDYDDVTNELLVRVIVSWCKHITNLNLSKRNTITITEFREIFQNCPNIKHLSLAFCTQVDDDILSLIGTYCKRLQSINLEGCFNTNDNSFYPLIELPLTSVNVSYCNMMSDDGGIFLVRNFKNLSHVNFDAIQWMSEEFVIMLVNMHYETLENVFLDGENLSDDAVRQISRCKHLRALSFSFCTLMTHHAIEWIGQCVNINHLQLRKGSNFTNASLLKYLTNMSVNQGLHFKYLNLAECSEISDKCLFYLSDRCPNLHTLDLSWCWEVSDDGLGHIIDNCHRLKELYLRGLHELYGTPFFQLSRSVPDLVTLDLNQCNKVADTLIQHIVENMKDLIVYNYYGEAVINARHRDAHRYIDK